MLVPDEVTIQMISRATGAARVAAGARSSTASRGRWLRPRRWRLCWPNVEPRWAWSPTSACGGDARPPAGRPLDLPGQRAHLSQPEFIRRRSRGCATWTARRCPSVTTIARRRSRSASRSIRSRRRRSSSITEAAGLLYEIDGEQPMEQVTASLLRRDRAEAPGMTWRRGIEIKSAAELELMRQAGRVNAEALLAAVGDRAAGRHYRRDRPGGGGGLAPARRHAGVPGLPRTVSLSGGDHGQRQRGTGARHPGQAPTA